MANIYVRSVDGNNADNGSTWALAKQTLVGAVAGDSPGDTIHVSQAHAESTSSTISIAIAGTLDNPVRIVCGNDSAEPPTTGETSGAITTTGSSSINFTGSSYSVHGLIFNCAVGSASGNGFNASGTAQAVVHFENCKFRMDSTSSLAEIRPTNNSAAGAVCRWINCDVRFGNESQLIALTGAGSILDWCGGGIEAGGTAPNTLFPAVNAGVIYRLSCLDLSQGATGMNLFAHNISNIVTATVRNCKLPAGWTGALVSSAVLNGSRYEMYNCDAGDTNYRLWIQDYAGSIRDETTIVRADGASDGATPLAWKMVTSANASESVSPLRSPEIYAWNDITGGSVTTSVEIVRDSATALTDAEIWLEVEYLGTAGYPLGVKASDQRASPVATTAAQAASSAAWTTTGLTSPNTQTLSVTFTPQEKGAFIARVVLAKPNSTVYVDPLVTVS